MNQPLPDPFIERLRLQRPADWQELAAALDHEPPVSVRIHPKKKHALPTDHAVPWCKSGFYLEERPVFTLDPLFHAGGYYVQEASSMFLEVIFDYLQPGGLVLDVCAAPGGKSTHLAGLLDARSLLVSNEAIRGRCAALLENTIKWGMGNTVVTHNDPADLGRLAGLFDVILVDAPCSGEGMFRKDRDARRHWTAGHVAHCSLRQQRILNDVWPALKNGGVLIYSTCTFNTAENELPLQRLAAQTGCESLQIPLNPAWGVEETCTDGIFGYRFCPHRVRGEGFFAAVIKKTEPTESAFQSDKPRKGSFRFEAARDAPAHWLSDNSPLTLVRMNDRLLAVPEMHRALIEQLATRLTVLYSGAVAGVIKNSKVVPAHDLALSVHASPALPRVELTREEALRYLRRENIPVRAPQTGFCLAAFQSQPLGWINALGHRINNLYPADWRIRMALPA
jgi:16S rRNA C967 or C1407 C5-methylase (RsmB/RsmF family)/NOL1/NOP2/fmu family ribosome biogenesis protein